MMPLKTVIPTQHIGDIEIELISYNEETGYSQFRISFDAFTKVEVKLTGDTITIINSEVKKILKERRG